MSAIFYHWICSFIRWFFNVIADSIGICCKSVKEDVSQNKKMINKIKEMCDDSNMPDNTYLCCDIRFYIICLVMISISCAVLIIQFVFYSIKGIFLAVCHFIKTILVDVVKYCCFCFICVKECLQQCIPVNNQIDHSSPPPYNSINGINGNVGNVGNVGSDVVIVNIFPPLYTAINIEQYTTSTATATATAPEHPNNVYNTGIDNICLPPNYDDEFGGPIYLSMNQLYVFE